MADNKPTVLVVLDGLAISAEHNANAVALANTPVLDALWAKYPSGLAEASGLAVGLPPGQMGNSEVGHLNIGAGRVVYQELTRISKSIADGDFFEKPAFLSAIQSCKHKGKALHLMGLFSDGGVHSHTSHVYALLELAKRHGLKDVYIHVFPDGRDVAPSSGKGFVAELEAKARDIGVGKIASIIGRYYAMDRDKRWERTKLAYDAMLNGIGARATSAAQCMEDSYEAGITDEFVLPTLICPPGEAPHTINPDDSIIFFNFRPDRARQIVRAILDPDFVGFERTHIPTTLVALTNYDPTIPGLGVAYHTQTMDNTLGEYLSAQGKTQLRLAETEKYAHVTFFLNGGIEPPNPGEDRILVPSPKAATYDTVPEMSAHAVADELVSGILSKRYDLVVVNFANPDMVGHTGILEAAIKAVEAVDTCLGRAVEAVIESGGQMLVCADHGNADKMKDLVTGEAFTAHTTNPVPIILVNTPSAKAVREGGKLCDIAPTLLHMMGIPQPQEMTGESLMLT